MAYYNVDKGTASKLPPIAQLAVMKGDRSKGKGVFNTYCTTCHQVNGNGTDFGPNLSEIGNKLAKEAIYKAIIAPDAGISFGFEGYIFKLKNGKQVLGYVTSETPAETAVKVIGGTVEKIPADNIISREACKHSLMPTGLATAMSREQLVNLVEYLAALKKMQ
jgi:putative heme-binding domain-containing protein